MRNAHFSDFPHILSCSQRCVEGSPGVSFPSVPWDDFLHEEILQQNRRAKTLHRVLTSAQKTTKREAGPRGGGRVWGERRRRRLPGGLQALWRQPRGGRAAPVRTVGGGAPEAAYFFGLAPAADEEGGASAPWAWSTAASPPPGASPQTPLCSCPRPGGSPAGGAEFPHWLSRRLHRLAPKSSGVVRLFSLLLVF